MTTIVVQFGLATIPCGASSSASGLTSLTTSGTSASIRQADELSTTVAPWLDEARRPLARRRAAGGEQRDVEAAIVVVAQRADDASSPSRRPARRSDANGTTSVGRERRARASRRSMIGPDGAGGADHGDPHDANSPNGLLGPDRAVARQLEGGVQRAHGVGNAVAADDAGDPDRRRGDHLDVDAVVRRASRTPSRRRRDACVMPAPTIETLPIASSVARPMPSSAATARARARGRQVVARDRERHVGTARRRRPARSG